MTRFQLKFSWIDPLDARGDELRATWAQLEVIVDDEVVSRLLDEGLNAVRNHVYLPLYPLAEWIAEHWWNLFHEAETDAPRPGAYQRHNLRFAGEGFHLPDLTISPVGELLQLTWTNGSRQGWAGEFLKSGSSMLPRALVREELTQFIESVVARLDDRGISDTYLTHTWSQIKALEPDQVDFCRTVGVLGLDPFALSDLASSAIIEAHNHLENMPGFDQEVETEFFQAAELSKVDEQAKEFVRIAERLVDAAQPVNGNLASNGFELHRNEQPWHEGYRLAQEFRKRLDLQSHRFADLRDLQSKLTSDNLPILNLPPTSFQRAAFARLPDSRVAFGLSDSTLGRSEIFTFSRALGSYLASPHSLGLVTGSQTYEQKMNRAFAAELLAPAKLLEEAFEDQPVTSDMAEEAASQFSVSPLVIRHQVENHGLGKFNF